MSLGNNPAVFFFNITSLKLSHISVENGTGYGIMDINILGNSSVSYTQDLYSTIFFFFVYNNSALRQGYT